MKPVTKRRPRAAKAVRQIFTPPVSTPTERDAARTDFSMLAVCCEPLESAVAAGVLVGARGRLYLRAGARAWFISFCPWCGEKRT